MQVLPGADRIAVLDSTSQCCLAPLPAVVVGTPVASWPVPELLSSSPCVYHFVIPGSESQGSRLAVVQQRSNKSSLPPPFL